MENKNLKEYSFYVEGMHCASCELLIEKKLLKQFGVKSVDASFKDCRVDFTTESEIKIDKEKLNQEFSSFGYKLTNSKPYNIRQKLITFTPEGGLRISKLKLKQITRNLLIVLGLLLAFFWVEGLQLGKYVSIGQTSTLSAFLLLGLVAGVSSCAALIGGLLLSLIKNWHEAYIDSDDIFERAFPHTMFHLGRLASFFILGGALGVVGDWLTFDNSSTYSFLTIIVSLAMVLLALQMLEVSWAKKVSLRLPKFITRKAATGSSNSKWSPLIVGAATFFLPCGFTLIAQGVALASGNFLVGALIMVVFALGTMPMLLAISISGLKFTSKPHLTAKFSYVAGMLIIFFALYNINGQLNVLGYLSLSDLRIFEKKYEQVEAQRYIPVGSEQIVSLVAKNFDYIPTDQTIFKAGVPTKLVVDNQGILGCGAFLASSGLISGFVPLDKGQNIIDLGSPSAGSYKVTCSMGMVPPVTLTFK